MSNKLFYLVSFGAVFAVVIFIFLNVKPSTPDNTIKENETSKQAIETEGNKQIINIKAKGGYFPSQINAKADTPTVLKVTTPGTYDCSVALVIPAIKFQKVLPTKGTTDIDLGTQPKGTTITGLCSMGMYRFNINFN